MATDYKLLEESLTKDLGGENFNFNTSNSSSFFASTSFIYVFAISIIIVAAALRYAYAGMLRIDASESGIKKSKEEFTRVTYGLLGVLGLWLILFTVNKDMLTGDVTLSNLTSKNDTPSGQNGGGNTGGNGNINTKPSGVSTSCEDTQKVKASLTTNNSGICGNTSCSLTSCLQNNQYISMVKSIASQDWKLVLVLLCKESSGNKNAQNRNENGTYDCGLMQVNQTTPCDASILDPQTNITKGVAKLREKMNSSTNQRQYPALQVRPETGVFTAYNCCANGTQPNSVSESCKTSDGWPEIPKWACPIDPGTGKFNMCGVKSYACDLTACLNQLN